MSIGSAIAKGAGSKLGMDKLGLDKLGLDKMGLGPAGKDISQMSPQELVKELEKLMKAQQGGPASTAGRRCACRRRVADRRVQEAPRVPAVPVANSSRWKSSSRSFKSGPSRISRTAPTSWRRP